VEYSGTKIVLVEYLGDKKIGLVKYSETKDGPREIFGDKNWSRGIFRDKLGLVKYSGTKDWSRGIFGGKSLVLWNIRGKNRDRHLKLLALHGTTPNLLCNHLT